MRLSPDTLKTRLRELAGRLSISQRIGLGLLLVACLAGLAGAVWLSARVEYVPFASGLTPAESGRLIGWLKDRKASYRADGSGGVLVAAEQAPELRMAFAAEGGVAGGAPIDLQTLLDSQFGMPEDVRTVLKNRAIESQLARSIQTLDAVRAARVHLGFPKESLFVEDARPPTAAVLLTLHPGKTLDRAGVWGIASLVAGAVPRLEAEAVRVLDQSGRILSSHDSALGGEVAGALDYQRQLERTLEAKATEVIERVVGVGRAVVRIEADLDLSRAQWTEESYDPERAVVRSEQTLNEERKNGGDRVGGAAGASANVAQGVVRVGDASQSTREKSVTNYEINKIVKQVQGPGVRLRRLSVAVIVDGAYKPAPALAEAAAASAEPEYVARTEAELGTIRALVAKAVGFDEARGDQLEVANVRFQQPGLADAEAQVAAARTRSLVEKAARYGLGLLAIVLGVFLVLRPLVRWVTTPPDGVEVLDDGELPRGEQLALPGAEELAALETDVPTLVEQLRLTAQEHPTLCSAVIRYWLAGQE